MCVDKNVTMAYRYESFVSILGVFFSLGIKYTSVSTLWPPFFNSNRTVPRPAMPKSRRWIKPCIPLRGLTHKTKPCRRSCDCCHPCRGTKRCSMSSSSPCYEGKPSLPRAWQSLYPSLEEVEPGSINSHTSSISTIGLSSPSLAMRAFSFIGLRDSDLKCPTKLLLW